MSVVIDQWGDLAESASGPLPASVLLALIERLSDGDPLLIGPTGARGLLQIHPDSAAPFGITALDLTNPEINLDTGVALLEQRGEQLATADPSLMQRLADLGRLTLAAYWFGPAKILSTMRRLGAGATAAQVLGQPGLEQMAAFVADVEGRQIRIDSELMGVEPPAGSIGEDVEPPLTGSGVDTPGAALELVAVDPPKPAIDIRKWLVVAGVAAVAIGGVIYFRNRA